MGERALALDIALVRQGAKFDPKYIDLFESFNPVTLTDQEDTPGRTRPLRCGLSGWWAKMELFSPDNADLRPLLFLDLDTYVLGSIDDMREPFTGFGMLRDFNRPDQPASGMMFIPKDTSEIWDLWSSSPQRWMDLFEIGGDQAFLGQFCDWFIQDRFDGITSYKRHSKDEAEGRVVCFHGFPKPHEVKDGWARDYWRNI